jgi:hypothetical protein
MVDCLPAVADRFCPRVSFKKLWYQVLLLLFCVVLAWALVFFVVPDSTKVNLIAAHFSFAFTPSWRLVILAVGAITFKLNFGYCRRLTGTWREVF